jgi:hypothetical protein
MFKKIPVAYDGSETDGIALRGPRRHARQALPVFEGAIGIPAEPEPVG